MAPAMRSPLSPRMWPGRVLVVIRRWWWRRARCRGHTSGLAATAGDRSASVVFTAPAADGGAPVGNYEYSTDNGANWTAQVPAATSSPVAVGGLSNGVTYPGEGACGECCRCRSRLGRGRCCSPWGAGCAVGGRVVLVPRSSPGRGRLDSAY